MLLGRNNHRQQTEPPGPTQDDSVLTSTDDRRSDQDPRTVLDNKTQDQQEGDSVIGADVLTDGA